MQSKNQPSNKSFLKLALKKQFIHGICSFSDRWCERCTKTQHCMSFAYRQHIKGVDMDLVDNDLANERFWNAIESVLKNKGSFSSFKVDFSETDEKLITESALNYKSQIESWLVENKLVNKEKAGLKLLEYGENEQITFADCVEIIRRYSSLIPNKVERSLNEKDERGKNPDITDKLNPYRDNVGSAKVAVIAVERSIAAFLLLQNELNEDEKIISDLMNQLLEIKNQTLTIFPDAMQFIRPGFDE